MFRAAILSAGRKEIEPDALPEHIIRKNANAGKSMLPPSNELLSLEEIERRHIEYVLSKTPSLEEAAQILQIDSATLWRKRKKYGF